MYLIKVKSEYSFLLIADTLRGLLENLEEFFGEGAKASISPEGYTIQVRLPNNLAARPVVAVLTKQMHALPAVNLPTLPFSPPRVGIDG